MKRIGSTRLITVLFASVAALSCCSSASSFAQAAQSAQTTPPAQKAILPTAPRLEFVYEARVQMGERLQVGIYGGSERGTTELLGGTFEGPKVRGKVLPSTRDWPIYLQNGVRTTDVHYVFLTDDGVRLFVTVRGFRYDLSKMKGPALESERVEPA